MDMKEATPYSKWGMLAAAGMPEDLLLGIFTGGYDDLQGCTENAPDIPTYGLLIELYHFACDNSSVLKLKVNRALKILVDALFPLCSVSRADHLESMIKGLWLSLESMTEDEQVLHLQKQWIPQPRCCRVGGGYILYIC